MAVQDTLKSMYTGLVGENHPIQIESVDVLLTNTTKVPKESGKYCGEVTNAAQLDVTEAVGILKGSCRLICGQLIPFNNQLQHLPSEVMIDDTNGTFLNVNNEAAGTIDYGTGDITFKFNDDGCGTYRAMYERVLESKNSGIAGSKADNVAMAEATISDLESQKSALQEGILDKITGTTAVTFQDGLIYKRLLAIRDRYFPSARIVIPYYYLVQARYAHKWSSVGGSTIWQPTTGEQIIQSVNITCSVQANQVSPYLNCQSVDFSIPRSAAIMDVALYMIPGASNNFIDYEVLLTKDGQTPFQKLTLTAGQSAAWVNDTARFYENWEANNWLTPDDVNIRIEDDISTYAYSTTGIGVLISGKGIPLNSGSAAVKTVQMYLAYLNIAPSTSTNYDAVSEFYLEQDNSKVYEYKNGPGWSAHPDDGTLDSELGTGNLVTLVNDFDYVYDLIWHNVGSGGTYGIQANIDTLQVAKQQIQTDANKYFAGIDVLSRYTG